MASGSSAAGCNLGASSEPRGRLHRGLVLTICEWIHVLDFGRPLMAGTAEDIRTSAAVRAAYLGQNDAV
ncbi:MAG TPA: hypothetical protein VG034_04095 [Acidimicrobiia bacterium]|nr:hypothetical protein [Acidimicrobiia bacterium]